MMAAAPSGVVTFLFTDIEGSTRRWESDAQSMRAALLGVHPLDAPASQRRDGPRRHRAIQDRDRGAWARTSGR
jgi:hypothetical protein